jgi:hypothetical protein
VAEQAHLEHCATVYGHTTPAAGSTTYFNQGYGWSSYAADGTRLGTIVTPLYVQPQVAVPPGGGTWKPINAQTILSAPLTTNLYMNAFTGESDTVRTLVHEWYHQNHDTASEGADVKAANEAAAKAAGAAAQAAFNADGGASCK